MNKQSVPFEKPSTLVSTPDNFVKSITMPKVGWSVKRKYLKPVNRVHKLSQSAS